MTPSTPVSARSSRAAVVGLLVLAFSSGAGTAAAQARQGVYSFRTLAGVAPNGSDDGVGPAARFYGPGGLAVDGAGTLYVADSFNHSIRKITSAATVTTLAGSPGLPGSVDGVGRGARFNTPRGIAVDA